MPGSSARTILTLILVLIVVLIVGTALFLPLYTFLKALKPLLDTARRLFSIDVAPLIAVAVFVIVMLILLLALCLLIDSSKTMFSTMWL